MHYPLYADNYFTYNIEVTKQCYYYFLFDNCKVQKWHSSELCSQIADSNSFGVNDGSVAMFTNMSYQIKTNKSKHKL